MELRWRRVPPPVRWWSGPRPYGARQRQAARRQGKYRYEAWESPDLIFLNLMGKTEDRGTIKRPAAMTDQKIWAALCSVIQTPHARGMPTKAQNKAALASKPPLPMPNDPDGDAPEELAPACSLATSASLMCHFGSTGLIR